MWIPRQMAKRRACWTSRSDLVAYSPFATDARPAFFSAAP